jgi:F-type H+-transporting ATPase subunit gamma
MAGLCFRAAGSATFLARSSQGKPSATVGAVVFGSDQGLVGLFNEVVADHAVVGLGGLTDNPRVWAVTPLIGQILIASAASRREDEFELHLFHNRQTAGAGYEPVSQRLLPLDEAWARELAQRPWPTKNLPEVIGSGPATLRGLLREYLFVSLFRACAESLASENASRLAAMQRADKNIDELLIKLHGEFHRLRQSSIDEELFDVIAGFDALSH